MVFQGYSSYPWLTVLENVAFGLMLRGVPRDEREQVARAWIEQGRASTGSEKKYPNAALRAACASGWPSPAPWP